MPRITVGQILGSVGVTTSITNYESLMHKQSNFSGVGKQINHMNITHKRTHVSIDHVIKFQQHAHALVFSNSMTDQSMDRVAKSKVPLATV